jgi:hypothetical protein
MPVPREVVELREVDGFDSGAFVLLEEKWRDRVEEQGALDHPGLTKSEVLNDNAAEVAAAGDAPRVAQYLGHQVTLIRRGRGDIVEVVSSGPRVTETSEVWGDDFAASLG